MSAYKKVKTLSHEGTDSEIFCYLSVNPSGVSKDGVPVLYAASQEGVVNMWNISPWKFLKSRELELDDNLLAIVGYGDKVYVGVGDGSVEVFDSTAKKSLFRLDENDKMITCLNVNSQFIIAGSWDNHVTIWDHKKTDKPVAKFEAHSAPLSAVETIGHFLVTACREDGIKIWDTTNNFKQVSSVKNKQGCKKLKAFGDSLYWLGDGDELKRWKIGPNGEFGEVTHQIELKRGLATSLALSKDYVFVGSSDGFIDIFTPDLKLEATQKTKERIEELLVYDSLLFASLEEGKILCYRSS